MQSTTMLNCLLNIPQEFTMRGKYSDKQSAKKNARFFFSLRTTAYLSSYTTLSKLFRYLTTYFFTSSALYKDCKINLTITQLIAIIVVTPVIGINKEKKVTEKS